jgi:hypothetical protein
MHNPQSYVVPVRPTNITRSDITIIILAANITYGMKTYGPKSLIDINSHETLIEYQINLIKTFFPSADILLVVGFYADRIIKKCPAGVRIIENQLFETLNEVEQLRLALNCTLTNNVLIMKEDIICNYETFSQINRNKTCLIFDSHDQLPESEIGINVVDGYATMLNHSSPNKWCHMAFFTNKELKILKNLCTRHRSRLFWFEIINTMLEKVNKILAIEPLNMQITKIDNSKILKQLQHEHTNS